MRLPNFSKHIAEAVVAAFALENSRILFLERFELSVAIERLERFEPTVVGRKRSQRQFEFCSNVKSELGLKASRREVIDEGGTYALREPSEAYGPNF